MKLALFAFAVMVPLAAAAAPQQAPTPAPSPEPAAAATPAPPTATATPDAAARPCPFAGKWKLNEELSDDPSAALREIAQQGGQSRGPGRGGRGGHGGGRGMGGRGGGGDMGGGGMGGGMGQPGGMGGGMGEPGGMGGGMGEPGGDDMGAPPDDGPGDGMGQAPPDEDSAVSTDGATTEIGNGDRRGAGRSPRGARGPRGGGAMDLLRRPPRTLAIAQNGAAVEIVEDGRPARRWIADGEPHPDERLGSGVATTARWIDASLAGEADVSSNLSVKQTFALAPEQDGARRLYVTTRVKLARAGKSVLVRRVYDAAP